jgi:signal transduction histidine kinase
MAVPRSLNFMSVPQVVSRSSPQERMVVGSMAAACLVAAVLVGQRAPPSDRIPRVLLEVLIVGIPILAGLYALRFPRNRRFGRPLIAAGFAWALTALSEASTSLPYSVGRLAAWIVVPIAIYLMLALPEGRLEARIDRQLFRFCIVLAVFLYAGSSLFIEAFPAQTPWATCRADCPANAFMVLDREPAVMKAVVQPLREGLTVILMLGVIASLVYRGRVASPFRRRAILPLIAMGVASAASLAAFLIVRRSAPDTASAASLGQLWSLTVPGMAAAFLVGILRQRMMLGDTLSALNRDVQRQLDLSDTRATLARTLGDSIDVLVPDTAARAWRNTDGAAVSAAALEEQGRQLTIVRDDGGRAVAALAHDAGVEQDDLLDGIKRFLGTAVQHAWATARLARVLVELDQSRARIARAADVERSRIGRDLHDGAQQRLIALRIRLSMVEETQRDNPQAWTQELEVLGSQIDTTLEELRALAHGVYPSLLTDRGLEEALHSVAAGAALPVAFETHDLHRYAPEIETAVYFTVLEALQNACKHAKRTSVVRLALWHEDGISFDVSDDGPGFELSQHRNGGLRNMHDRIEAVGGVITIDSTPARGTRVTGFVPRASSGHRGMIGAGTA